MKPEAPCKDCTKREVGCHSTCPDYISFKNENNKINELKRSTDVLREYKSESRSRYLKWKRNSR